MNAQQERKGESIKRLAQFHGQLASGYRHPRETKITAAKLRGWLHNAKRIAEQAETQRREIQEAISGEPGQSLLAIYVGDAAVGAKEAVQEIERQIELQTAMEKMDREE